MNSRIELPEVYSESLSYYQDISKLVAKMNELIKGYNAIPKYVIDEINEAIKKLPDPSGGTNDHTQLTNRDAEDQHPQSAITGLVAALAAKYVLPTGGIPATDLANAVQTSLGKADTAYQKPSSGIPSSDMSNAVQTSLGKADTALQSVPDLSATYVTVAQGVAHAGEFLVVNSSGNVVPVALSVWEGGSY